MLAELRARQPGHSLWRIGWWYLCQGLCFASCVVCYRYRAWGLRHIPRQGPVLFISNHQSFLDPVLIGVGGHTRHFFSMARTGLWRWRLFGMLLDTLNSIPIDQGRADPTAMRRCINVLQQGHALLVFPEGSRTLDGELDQFASGIMLLIRRARPIVIPVAVEGTFEVWPPGQSLPRPWGVIGVMFGSPMRAESLIEIGTDAALASLHETVKSMKAAIGNRLSKS